MIIEPQGAIERVSLVGMQGIGGDVRDRPDADRIDRMMVELNALVWRHGFGTTGLRIIEQKGEQFWEPIKVQIDLVQLPPTIANEHDGA